jgi:DNA-binding protein HU-beta
MKSLALFHNSLSTCSTTPNRAETRSRTEPQHGGNDMPNQMTKAQLIAAVAETTGSDRKSAAAALDALAAIINREVSAGGAVTVPGVGKIYCRERPARQVRNPATGAMVAKPADRSVKITVAKALKDSVNR